MIKLVSLLLSFLILSAPLNMFQGNVLMPVDEEEIDLSIPDSGEPERGPLNLVRATLSRVDGNITINLAPSLGVTSITVLNSQDQTVYYTSVDASLTGTVQFAVPAMPDTYTLVIQSSSYYGIGVFQIQ